MTPFATLPDHAMTSRPTALLISAILGACLQLAHAQSGGQNNPPESQQQSFNVPSGPKSISFDAAPAADPNNGPVEVSITDGNGKLLVNITLKPKKKNPDQADGEVVWDVFYSIGNGPQLATNSSLPAGQLTTFTAIFTNQGISFRFGPAGEGSTFSSDPVIPQGFNLAFTALKVTLPDTAGVEFSGFRTNGNSPSWSNRQNLAPQADIPKKPVLSPP